jgi:hypothetical protein
LSGTKVQILKQRLLLRAAPGTHFTALLVQKYRY